jgi:hypothetical protein
MHHHLDSLEMRLLPKQYETQRRHISGTPPEDSINYTHDAFHSIESIETLGSSADAILL